MEFAPSVTIEHTPAVLKEGDTVIFQCRAQANPDNVTYQWFVDGKEQALDENASKLVITGLKRGNNGEIVKCRVRNTVGKSEETKTLDIFCKSL